MSSGHQTWDTRFADFALVLDTGKELRCHKNMLVKCSPFFDAMLSSDCEETKSGKMKAKGFSLETVTTFLEQVYAIAFKEKCKEENKLTPELMRMCHMYQFQDLYKLTVDHLMKNICDTNAVKLWCEAEKIKNEEMKSSVISFITNKKKDIANLADVDEAYKCPELMKSLVDSFVDRNEGQKIAVSVGGLKVHVRTSDTVRRLKEELVNFSTNLSLNVDLNLNQKIPLEEEARLSFDVFKGKDKLDDYRTLESYGIQDGSKIELN